MRDAEAADATRSALGFEPLEMLAPEHEVVHLLHLDVTFVPLQLPGELLAALGHRPRPDLRRDDRFPPTAGERCGERRLGTSVHRRGVEQSRAGREGRVDYLACEPVIGVECVPRAETDDGAEPPFHHHEASADSTSARVTSTIASRSATEMCSAGV